MTTDAVPPLRIVHYLPEIRLEDGGIVRAVLDWCAVLSARGNHVTLLTYDAGDCPTDWAAKTVVLPRPRGRLRRFPTDAMATVAGALRDAHVLHLHAPWLVGNRQIAAAADRSKVPYIVSAHGMLDDWSMAQRSLKKRTYLALVGRRFLNRAARVHCTAEAEMAQARKWFDTAAVVLPCLVDLTQFETLPGPGSAAAMVVPPLRDKPRLLFLSRLHEKKGVHILIEAAGLLRDAGVDFALVLAGTADDPAYTQSLLSLVARLKLVDHVAFLGLVTGAAKISLYQSADVFVLPTRQENFGLVLIEAMAAGTPVVTTRGTDIWREVQAAGGVIADLTPSSLATTIASLLADVTGRAARGASVRQWVFSTLATDPLCRRYEELFRALAR